ncbi:G patch domain and ankyrin repeat-containing protein 1 homolog isoform X1 [Schistocerca piceifrons]|uniref:G patch domain and ankyrin repeat-containing protein 1 homolog isoform X1 n=1 Tax=Schistocerca piceifrons TaxID=274613 RepID=UPI001F5FE52A|nr:G patch domain and ankyrin repeat-containing protein 1 homolog isoform X1 [Schistocerca piceifrons]
MALHPNWRSLSTAVFQWKTFVREGDSYVPRKGKTVPASSQNLTGDEAKRLYEEIVKQEPEKSSVGNVTSAATSAEICLKNVRHANLTESSPVSSTPLDVDGTTWINNIMKAAQSNDVSSVSSLLKGRESNINTVDQYGWTVLMCAAASGSLDVVKLLVDSGADIDVKDRSGNSSLSIAEKMKHFHVVNYMSSRPVSEEKPISRRRKDVGLGLLENPQHSLRLLSEIEEIGEEILRDRNEVVALDRRRNQTREALRAIQKSTADKVWVSVGSLLIKIPEKKATEMLKRDQIQVDVEINKMRSELKLKVNKLRDMEHQAPVPGLMLNALTSSEMGAIKTAMGFSN